MGEKAAIRTRIWDRLEVDSIARFPFPPHGRIPNFAGASEAGAKPDGIFWSALDAETRDEIPVLDRLDHADS